MPRTPANILRYLGLMGSSGVHTGSLVPRANTPDADQRLWRDFTDAGKVGDPDIWSKYNSMMKRPTTFESMLQLWDEMAGWDLIAAALVEIVDEATQTDANSPGTIWYECNDQDFEDELNDMLVKLGVEDIIQSQVWHIAAYGNHFEKLEYVPNEGILGMSYVHPMDVRRYWLERNRRAIGFSWRGHKPNKEDVFVAPDNRTQVERVQLTSGQGIEDLYYPWDFVHFRRMFRMRMSEHGEPIFAEADGIYKKLRLAVDQMVVHRAQVQPDRYAINIDVQEQPPVEQMRTVQRWRQALRSKLAFGTGSSESSLDTATDFSSYYNALALDTVLYIAQPKGFQHAVTKIPGTADVPDVYDIELLTDLFFSIIGMPRSWLGGQGGDGGGDAPSGKALLAQDIRFLRKIKSIRKPLIAGYEWLAYFHASLRGKNLKMLDIKAMMPPIGGLEEQMKMEILSAQSDVLLKLGDVMEQYNLPKEAWIETIFKRYMHLPDDVVNVFLTALPAQIGTQEESLGGKPAPRLFKLVREIDEKLKGDPQGARLIARLKTLAFNDPIILKAAKFEESRRKKFSGTTFSIPEQKDYDIIVSSYGRHPFEFKRTPESKVADETGSITNLMENGRSSFESVNQAPPAGIRPSWRKWIK